MVDIILNEVYMTGNLKFEDIKYLSYKESPWFILVTFKFITQRWHIETITGNICSES